MPRLAPLTVFTVLLLGLGGCCRDTIREMGSLKDVVPERSKSERSAKAKVDGDHRSAKVDRDDDDDDDDDKPIETGSVGKPDCQGQHLAYQATKEYLKNFGPKPPDQPGEKGPCKP